ncbi:MAG: ABC transporter permease [Proteobacteria bacterium]|nr:ABC transporter permease [Pseudomonadota bacterium]
MMSSNRNTVVAWILLAPATIFLVVLFVLPLVEMLVLSFTDPKLSFDHFIRIFTVPVYLKTLRITFQTALIVTAACLLLGYPLAYAMVRLSRKWSVVLLALVGISFWTSFLVRTYAWMVVLGTNGPIAYVAKALGAESPRLLFTNFAAILGMTHLMLPYMVMALFAVMSRIDPDYQRAAENLGATPFRAFRSVFLPLSLPGVINGSLLVFMIVLGFFVTPQLLGSPRGRMISQLVAEQIQELLAWGFGSALAVVLLATTLVFIAIYNRFAGIDRLWGD